jgi:hypothetical protein
MVGVDPAMKRRLQIAFWLAVYFFGVWLAR